MTAYTNAMLPTGTRAITTFEELNFWSCQVLYACNPNARFKRTPDIASELIARYGGYDDSDGFQRVQAIVVPRVDITRIGLALPDWKQLLEISVTPAPAALIG